MRCTRHRLWCIQEQDAAAVLAALLSAFLLKDHTDQLLLANQSSMFLSDQIDKLIIEWMDLRHLRRVWEAGLGDSHPAGRQYPV